MKDSTINISTKSILITIFTLVGLFMLFLIKDILLALFMALIVMSALNPTVTWMQEKRKIPRPLAIFIHYLLLFFILFVFFNLIIPPLVGEFPKLVNTFQSLNYITLPKELTNFQFNFSNISSIVPQFGSSFTSILGIISSTFSGIFFALTTLVMSFYLLLERNELHKKPFYLQQSPRLEKLFEEYLLIVEKQLGGWIRGQLVLMFSIGFITFIVLTILRIPYAVPLAVLAGFLEILPNIGPTLAAIPAVIIAFIISPSLGLIVLCIYIMIQQLENNILVPKIMKAAVDIDPLTSIVLILVGIKLGGVIGALLSIPIYIVIRSGFQLYLRERK